MLPATGEIRAVLSDVDGTLYRQGPVRARMALDLARAHVLRPALGWRVARALRAYRRAQEILRCGDWSGSADEAQFDLASRMCGLPSRFVRDTVGLWMEERPLVHLPRAARPGVVEFFAWCVQGGMATAAVSDYDPRRKLLALGLRDSFRAIVCAQDPEVGRFKPDPRGIEAALDALGVAPREAVYVGDRAEVDGVAALRAGVTPVILGENAGEAGAIVGVESFDELRDWLTARASPESPLSARKSG